MSPPKDPDIDQAALKASLHYDPLTGEFSWLKYSGNKPKGSRAGGLHPDGYRRIRLGYHSVAAHRLAWLYMYGSFPDGPLDHINCDRGDNRIANLRLATHRGNVANRRIQKNNKSGAKGVHWAKTDDRWNAQIKINGKKINLGYFADIEDAKRAYADAARKYFGEFARAA